MSQRTSLSQQAYYIIKHKIVSLQLEPGTVIDESTLREELQVGRTPIREALKRLEQDKLVTIVPRRGMFVSEIGYADLNQLCEVRLVLESLAIELAAARGTEAHWKKMEDVLQRASWDETTPQQLIEIDEGCHRIIYAAADNRFLEDTLIIHYALSLRLWYFFLGKVGGMGTAVKEHQHIFHALQTGNVSEAIRLMQQHILDFQTEIQAAMLGAPRRVQ